MALHSIEFLNNPFEISQIVPQVNKLKPKWFRAAYGAEIRDISFFHFIF